MSTTSTHPALVTVRQTHEYAALLAEFKLAAAQTYGGEAWHHRRRNAQGAILRMEDAAIAEWDAMAPAIGADGSPRWNVWTETGHAASTDSAANQSAIAAFLTDSGFSVYTD